MELAPLTKRKLSANEALLQIGDCNRFQYILVVVMILLNIPASFQIIISYFFVLVPDWRCTTNSTACNFTGTLSSRDIRRCDVSRDEWYYTAPKDFSLVTSFDIHCQDKWMLNLVTSMFFIGWGAGAVVVGYIADKYGRKNVLFISLGLMQLIGLITSFVPYLSLVIICRFGVGFFFAGTLLQGFILVSELVGDRHRATVGILFLCVSPISWCILALKAYLTSSWKILSIITSAPYLLTLISFYKFVPESLQWLESHRRVNKIDILLSRIAHWNKIELPDNLEISFRDKYDETRVPSSNKLLESSHFARTIVLAIIWANTSVAYYGVTLASNELGGSIYRDFAILSIVELPARFASIVLCDKFGRKKSVLLSLFGSGVASVGIAFIPTSTSMKLWRVAIGIVGKISTTVTLSSIYTWSSELYLVDIRSKYMGVLAVAARIGGACAPWVMKGLKPFGYWCPWFVLALPCFIAAFIGTWLPETNKKQKESALSDCVKQ